MKNLDSFVLKQGTANKAEVELKAKRPKVNSVTLIYVPLYCGGRHKGTLMGPSAVRVAELSTRLQNMGLKVDREVEIKIPEATSWKATPDRAPKCVPEILEVCEELATVVEHALDANTIPITIGGDHSLAIGSLTGASAYYRKRQEEFGLIWFDAHGDINTPQTSHSGNVHGMPFAVSIGHGDERLVNLRGYAPKVRPDKSVLIGLRDLDPDEREMIAKSGITAFSMRDIDHMGVARVSELALSAIGPDVSGLHVSFDIDVMDPDVAPGVSTPSPGGLNFRESSLALTFLAETELVRSIDIAELNPANDVKNRTAEIAVNLALTCMGSRIL